MALSLHEGCPLQLPDQCAVGHGHELSAAVQQAALLAVLSACHLLAVCLTADCC